MFNKKCKVSFINPKWEFIKQNVVLDIIPNISELIYIEELGMYFEVMNVVHKLNNKQNIFIIIKEFPEKG